MAKKAIQDRRGVSEIKRSEAALKEENAGLRALLQSNTDDKVCVFARFFAAVLLDPSTSPPSLHLSS